MGPGLRVPSRIFVYHVQPVINNSAQCRCVEKRVEAATEPPTTEVGGWDQVPTDGGGDQDCTCAPTLPPTPPPTTLAPTRLSVSSFVYVDEATHHTHWCADGSGTMYFLDLYPDLLLEDQIQMLSFYTSATQCGRLTALKVQQ